MRVFEQLRNTVFPPPAAILGVALVGIFFIPREDFQAHPDPMEHQTGLSADTAMAEENMLSLTPPTQDQNVIAEITVRPLFLQGRRPWQEIIQTEAPPIEVTRPEPSPPVSVIERKQIVPPQISLLGIVRDSDHITALIADTSGQNERWVSVDEQVADWTVFEIQTDRLILRAEGEEIVVTYNR